MAFILPGLKQAGWWKRVLRCAGVHRASGPWFQNQVLENQKQVMFHACQLHFHLVTNHASLLLLQHRDWLCYACPLSPAVCVNAQGYKHTEKKIQFTVAAFGAVPLDAGRSGIHDMLPPRVTNRINDIYGNTKEVTPTWWSIYRSTYLFPGDIIAIITPNSL